MTDIDEKEQTLVAAEKATREAYAADASTENLRRWRAAGKALDEYRQDRDTAADGRRFKSVADVYRYLTQMGWSTTDRTVRNHAKAGHLPEAKGGGYLLSDVERYAQTYLHRPGGQTPSGPPADSKDALVSEQVRKLKLANDIEEGRYILRTEVEQRSAAAAAYLKNDLMNFGPRVTQRLVEHAGDLLKQLGVDDVNLAAIIPDLELVYEKNLSAWLNRYAEASRFPEKRSE